MAGLTEETGRAVALNVVRGSNDYEMIYLADKPFKARSNGSYAEFGTITDVKTFATLIGPLMNAAVSSVSGKFKAKDNDVVRVKDDLDSVASTFTIKHRSNSASFPNIVIYFPKVIKKTSVDNIADALLGLTWKRKDGQTYVKTELDISYQITKTTAVAP